jgi:RNA polymerase sigma-70 factor (ECF subfamily)
MILADPAGAEDVVHDVFAKIASGGPDALRTPDAYLRRAVRNACYDVLRQSRVRRTDESDSVLLETVAGPADVVDERLEIERALRSLPPEQREVVHLKIFEGLTFQEIAKVTDTPANTVASRYRYAIEKVRVALGASDTEPSHG